MFKLIVVATLLVFARGQDQPDASTSTTTVSPSPPPGECEGPNEVFLPQGVAPSCDTVCSEIGKPCKKQFVQAPSGCYCLPDHARNASNVCVPISECQIKCQSVAPHLPKLPDLAMIALLSELLKPKKPHKPLLSSLEPSPEEPPAEKPSPLDDLHLNSLPKLPLPLPKDPHKSLLPSDEPSKLESAPLEQSLSKLSHSGHFHWNSAQQLLPPELPLSLPHPHLLPHPPLDDCQISPQSMAAISSMSSVSSMSSIPGLESHGPSHLLPHVSHISLSHPPQLHGVYAHQYYLPQSASFAADC